MGRMTEKQSGLHRLQPAIGALVLALGLTVLALVVQKGLDSKSLPTAGMSGMMTMGGLSLLFRARISRGRAGLWALGGAVAAAIAVSLATIP